MRGTSDLRNSPAGLRGHGHYGRLRVAKATGQPCTDRASYCVATSCQGHDIDDDEYIVAKLDGNNPQHSVAY